MTNDKSAAAKARSARTRVRPITPSDWNVVEQLFGARGACGGCWCMYWRVRGGKIWDAQKGDGNRRAFKQLIERGAVTGSIAFCGDEPVGWCCIGPKQDFLRLAKSRVLATDAAPRTWAVTCFYIPAKWRNRGVASALLRDVVKLARARGADELEGYPIVASQGGDTAIPAAFAWTGVPTIFERNGFTRMTRPAGMRPIYLRQLRRRVNR
ncbi:MAG: GNAT family N-acetyltransferase [Planctomycetota bacterium]